MRQNKTPSQSLICFELTQEQALHIAASLASDIGSAADFMPKDFHVMHLHLIDMFMTKLSADQKTRVLNAITFPGVLQ